MKNPRVFDGQRGLIAAIFVASMFVNVLFLTAPLYMMQLFSRVLSSGSMSTLAILTIGAAIALVFFFAFDALRQRLMARLGTRLEARLGPVVLGGIVRDTEVAEAMGTQPVRDLQELRSFVTSPYFTALLDAPWSVVFIAAIFIFHPALGLVALMGIAVLFSLGVLSELAGREPNKTASDASQQATRSAEEMLRNADIVRAMGQTPTLVQRWQKQSFLSMIFGNKATDRVAMMTSLAKAIRMFIQIAVLGIGVVLVLEGELTPGVMIASSILLGRAAAPVEQSIAGWGALMQVRLGVARLNALLARFGKDEHRMELPEPDGRLSVENATVVMPGRQDPILFDVSFELRPGMSMGLIGSSGAGKTTLARTLAGLQPLSRGFVRIDDAALADWPAEQIGNYIGFLPQRVELFQGTVAENIALMDDEAAPADIVEAAKRAEVHDLILGLPNGYNTQVGLRGEHLSAGQRQRIGLARAFFGHRRLIVLDEPNANLDPDGEEALARAVENATNRGAVVIVVTHRMSILRRVSHAGVMDKGRLVRFGASREIFEAAGRPVAQQYSDDGKVTFFRRNRAQSDRPARAGGTQ
ncbi:MAG: type I secretion system permease/ATPase [Paracoccaceae bacterium]